MARERTPSDKKQKPSNTYLKYSSLGLQLLLLLAAAGWLGYKLDEFLKLKVPVFLILFVISGFGGFLYRLYQSINKP